MRRAICALLALWPAWAAAQEVGPVFVVSATRAVDAPKIGMAGDGRFVLAWIDPANNVLIQRFDADGALLGGVFQVNTATLDYERRAAIGMNGAGQFVVAWTGSAGPYGGPRAIVGRRFAADGSAQGAVFTVNANTTGIFGNRVDAAVALDGAGDFVVTWPDWRPLSTFGTDILARRFASDGTPLGGDLLVNAGTAGWENAPSATFTQDGSFVVAWESIQPGGPADVFARRFDAGGAPLGGDVAVNQYTTGIQGYPAVAALGNEAVVAWVSDEGADGSGPGVFARRLGANGSPLGSEFRVSDSPVRFVMHACSVVADARGGFAVGWSSGFSQPFVRRYQANGQPLGPPVLARSLPGQRVSDTVLAADQGGRLAAAAGSDFFGGGFAPEGVRYEGLWTAGLSVDRQAGGTGDVNGVLDPGEVVAVAPSWANAGAAAALGVSGTASAFTGPGAPSNPTYAILDGSADYGTITEGTTRSCGTSCYLLGVGVPAPRPLQHIDAAFREDLAWAGAEPPTQTWAVHVGGSFTDMPRSSPYYRFAETVFHFGVSGGCGGSAFCPDAATTREQMAVFLLTAKLSPRYQPPRPAVGVFTDVPVTNGFAPWIEDLWNREIVEGCGTNVYCPGDPVTRAQMALMLLRTLEGTSYVPPACTTPVFGDVPCSDPFARWINELSARGITAGCGGGLYCPSGSVTRAQMGVFISRTFGLDMYAPAGLQARRR